MQWSRLAWGVPFVLLAGCGLVLPPVDVELVAIAQKRWPDATQVQLDQGRTLFTTRCTTCHAVRDPEHYSPKDWSYYLDVMGPRAQLAVSERQAIERYVNAARDMGVSRP